MPTLVFAAGKAEGTRHAITRAAILGRQKGVDVLVDDIGASREHAKVFQQDGDWFVIDLNSRNGTKVNGSPVTRWRLNHGDRISIGTTVLAFEAPEIASRAAPAPPAAAPAA
ncbi:MAG: FHA domain-containing protein, partial [Planctomycetes bacterium]|nr:FHA domain-containing protein [Planctomycetota bacterium]